MAPQRWHRYDLWPPGGGTDVICATPGSQKNELHKLLQRLKNDKKSIVGFGAPAKATTFLYHFSIKPEIIDYIIDDSPLKEGLFTPGMHIPVYSSEKLCGSLICKNI